VDQTFADFPDVARGLRGAIASGEVWVSGPPTGIARAGSAPGAALYVFTALPLYDGAEASGVAVFAQDVSGPQG
jgi:hypothetical protein